MFKKTLPFLLIFFLPLASALLITGNDIIPSPPTRPFGEITVTSAKDWAIIWNGRYHLENNVFNKFLSPGPYSQRMFLEKLNGKIVPGWQWNWPFCPEIASFPEYVYGNSPWDKFPGVPGFPHRAGSKRIIVDYDLNLKANGVYRITFLLWVVAALPASNQNITHDIFITIDNHNMTPAGRNIGILVVDGHSFGVNSMRYVHSTGPDRPICYVEFVAKEPLHKETLDLSVFMDYLLKKGVLSSDQYVTNVELGTQVVGGTGLMELKDYSVTVR